MGRERRDCMYSNITQNALNSTGSTSKGASDRSRIASPNNTICTLGISLLTTMVDYNCFRSESVHSYFRTNMILQSILLLESHRPVYESEASQTGEITMSALLIGTSTLRERRDLIHISCFVYMKN